MALHAPKSSGTFEPCPAGAHVAVCCDIIDLGMVQTNYQGEQRTQHKVRILWQIAKAMKDGKPYLAAKRYTFSVHEKASLRKDLNAWRGRAFTDAEAEAFDFEKLVGLCCFLNVVHTTRQSTTYADVVSLMPLPKGVAKIAVRDYVRVKDRPTTPPAAAPAAPPVEPGEFDGPGNDEDFTGDSNTPSDDDVPF